MSFVICDCSTLAHDRLEVDQLRPPLPHQGTARGSGVWQGAGGSARSIRGGAPDGELALRASVLDVMGGPVGRAIVGSFWVVVCALIAALAWFVFSYM